MKNRGYKVFLLFLAVLCMGGCTIHYVPDPTAYEFGEIDEFVSAHSISLINDQPFSEGINLYGALYVNFQKWTDVAIDLTHRELSKRGMTIVSDSEKQLKLSIIDAKVRVIPFSSHAPIQVFLRVETREGYVKTYTGKAVALMNLYSAIDSSVIRVVSAMLRDPDIVKYLKE